MLSVIVFVCCIPDDKFAERLSQPYVYVYGKGDLFVSRIDAALTIGLLNKPRRQQVVL